MRFTDGFWQLRPGVHASYAAESHDVEITPTGAWVTAPDRVIGSRGETLNRPVLTVSVDVVADGVLRVRSEHFAGAAPMPGFPLTTDDCRPVVRDKTDLVQVEAGTLTATIRRGAPFAVEFSSLGRRLTGLGGKSLARVRLDRDARAHSGLTGDAAEGIPGPTSSVYSLAQLDLGIGETVYGLGERFGPVVKNGQTVEIWNADGGTSSEQAYKNVPFYLTNRGYGVLVNNRSHVSFEVGSEAVERVQFSVPGEAVEFLLIDGPTPKDVLRRYTALTGRPAHVPAWSYGLWLSTSFTTDYDEATVNRFIDGMAQRDIPVSVFHFDCFWMREFNWCDFEWDSRVFPDPSGMLDRLHAKNIRVSVWINPYIGQRSPLFQEAAQRGYLVKTADGAVWQWDQWQAGMGLVDFTDPAATAWFQDKLRALVAQGVDCFKTDFGERIPVTGVFHDGSDATGMHNWYTQLYNKAVFDVLEAERGAGDAVVFARSATVGGQQLPVHWGGDSTSTYASMAETLRGGLSLAFSGFGFWSHDIGGFEGTPDADVFKRWTAFGLLSSHSRLHGSTSYRVPWAFDDEAVDVTRQFTSLKLDLMPYLYAAGVEAHQTGIPILRPMLLEFPDDPGTVHLDRQYMLGPDLLVAPVFDVDGDVDVYLPGGRWTHLLTGEAVDGGGWRRERHGFDSLPLYVRPGAVLPRNPGARRPDRDYLEDLVLDLYGGADYRPVTVTTPAGRRVTFTITTDDGRTTVVSDDPDVEFRVRDADTGATASGRGEVRH